MYFESYITLLACIFIQPFEGKDYGSLKLWQRLKRGIELHFLKTCGIRKIEI
jgi:hypothetical protein